MDIVGEGVRPIVGGAIEIEISSGVNTIRGVESSRITCPREAWASFQVGLVRAERRPMRAALERP